MQKVLEVLRTLKQIIFQFLFIIQHNTITNKHVLTFVELIEIFPLVYFYLNPIYSQLKNFWVFEVFFDTIWPQIFLFNESKQFLVILTLLMTFPAVLMAIVFMKVIIGYQYLLIVAIQLWLVVYPVFFIKFGIETFNIIVGFSSYRGIGIVAALVHTLGSVMVLHLHNKKYKLLDLLPILLIYCNTNQYAVFAVVIVRLILSYFMASDTLIKPLRIRIQTSLLIVIIFTYFSSDNLTNYISFILLLSTFSITEALFIVRNYHSYEPIFYHLQNVNEEESYSRLEYYQFVENHRIQCENLFCMCRQLGEFKTDEDIKTKGYEFVSKLYSFREDFNSRIQLGSVCCQQYEYTLSGLLLLLQLKPSSIYQQYLLYYVKTKYEQEYRKNDKNYTFGQQYHNAHEDLRNFQERIQNLTTILKEFWNSILYFDGSSRFLSLILKISEKITEIREMYEVYIDKYEQFGNNFRYLYKTFEIAILNLLDKQKQENQNSFGVIKQEIQIKVPQRIMFFISNSQEKIVNCNREFCNLVELDKEELINKSYSRFIPETCNQVHSLWAKNWYQNYNREEESNQTIKPILLTSSYTKAIKMQNKIIPRFDKGIEIMTFIKLISKLQQSSIHKSTSNESTHELNAEDDESSVETFFSFMIEKQSLKIVGMDDSFFYTTMIEESQILRKKIFELKLTQMFPKFVMIDKDKQADTVFTNEGYRQVMLNYSILEELLQNKQKNTGIKSIASIGRNFTLSRIQSRGSSNDSEDDFLAFGKKNIIKQSTLGLGHIGSNVSGFNSHIKDTNEQIYQYEIINQINPGLAVEYCLVNFKLKKNVMIDMETRMKEQQAQIKHKPNNQKNQPQAKSSHEHQGNDEQMDDDQHNKLIPTHPQTTSSSIFANLSHREPFIRSSKPYQEEESKKDIETKKAELQESDELNNEQKDYCLPWPILISLFIVHALYSQISGAYGATFVYLQNTFDFYDMYQLQILKQLYVSFDNSQYEQDLKGLWIQGYGFYHQSILTFQNPSDPYFISKLYDEVIKQYHYGIYQQIQSSLNQKIANLHLFYYLILAVLSLFILYVIVDFALNLRYCFRISSKVTEIILIFLNISEADINKLIFTITKYQTSVLEMISFAEIEQEKKISMQDYRIDDPEALEAAELSGVGLLKNQSDRFGIEGNLPNVDLFVNYPEKSPSQFNEVFRKKQSQNIDPPVTPIKNNKSQKQNPAIQHKRRNSRADKIDFQQLKQSVAVLRTPAEDEISEKNFLLPTHKKNDSFRKSNFSNNTSIVDGSSPNKLQFPAENMVDKINQQDDNELTPEEESKLTKISNFKKRFRGILNDVRENPRSYVLLLIVLLLTTGVFVTVFVLIPKFVMSFETFSDVYFDLRKLKIVLFKELIKKATLIELQPDVKASVYSQDFYFTVQNQLGEIPNFQEFWKKIYSSNVCPYISNQTIQSSCTGLDNLMTSYGQKVMFQYLQDFLRRKNSTELFQSNSSEALSFMIISRIQAALVTEGDKAMSDEMNKYLDKVGNLEMIVAIVGTVVFVICIYLSHKALKDIRLKIKDGQNLLLVMPENIKKKYIEQMKKNRVKELTRQLAQEQQKRRPKKRRSQRISTLKKQPDQQSQTAVELMKSDLIQKEENSLVKSDMKNSNQKPMNSSRVGISPASPNKKESYFKE